MLHHYPLICHFPPRQTDLICGGGNSGSSLFFFYWQKVAKIKTNDIKITELTKNRGRLCQSVCLQWALHVQLFTGHFPTFSVSETWTKEPRPGPTDSSRFLLGLSCHQHTRHFSISHSHWRKRRQRRDCYKGPAACCNYAYKLSFVQFVYMT